MPSVPANRDGLFTDTIDICNADTTVIGFPDPIINCMKSVLLWPSLKILARLRAINLSVPVSKPALITVAAAQREGEVQQICL